VHCPVPAAGKQGMDAACERILARETRIAFPVPCGDILGPVERLGLEARGGLELRFALFVSTHRRTGFRFQVPSLKCQALAEFEGLEPATWNLTPILRFAPSQTSKGKR